MKLALSVRCGVGHVVLIICLSSRVKVDIWISLDTYPGVRLIRHRLCHDSMSSPLGRRAGIESLDLLDPLSAMSVRAASYHMWWEYGRNKGGWLSTQVIRAER